ncbi:hypothetical protein AB6A40_003486 [Gnathostoma spinigerum]|uniref:Chromo domain-containing protein n=1 Tax=Gnathostoma spinigerum TaxID=75299 RepID=A0ABD6EJP0_9BILA
MSDEKLEEYVVEKVLGKRFNSKTGKTEYLIKWRDYDDEDNTWEPEENCDTASDAIREFEESQNEKTEKQRTEPLKLNERAVSQQSGSDSHSNDAHSKRSSRGRQLESTNSDSGEKSIACKPALDETQRKTIESLKMKTHTHDDRPNGKDAGKTNENESKSKSKTAKSVQRKVKKERKENKSYRAVGIEGVTRENDELVALVRYTEGKYRLVSTSILREKHPGLLIDFYEKHLNFVKE